MSEESTGSVTAGDSTPNVAPGIRDWLVLFFAFMALNVVILAYKTLTAFVALSWIGVFYGLNAVVLVIGLALVYGRDPLAPRFWRAVLIVTAAFNVLLAAVHLMVWSSALFSAVVLIGWAIYWNNSLLVRATFSGRASAPSPDETQEQPFAEDPSDAVPLPSVEELNAELDLASRQERAAVLYILIGLAFTAGTYVLASSAGGTYVVTWGAVLYGIVQSIRANTRRNRAQALLQKTTDVTD